MILLLVPTTAFAVEIVNVSFLFDITDNFKEPSDVAVSKTGRIYVLDGVNNKIKVFGPDGAPIFSFGSEGKEDGGLMYPLGLDVDDSGTLYIADSGNHRVQVFDPDGHFMTSISLPEDGEKPADPTDVAVDDQRNRLYVVDNDNHCIHLYDLLTGKRIKTIGQPGEQELMFRYPFFAALNKDQYLYVVDVINTRVQVINPDGLFVTYIGGWGVEKGQFFRPKGVAVDGDDKIYVSDSYMGVIQVFDTWGEFRGVLGNIDQKTITKFKTPVGLYIDNRNRLYVVEMLAEKISVYQIESKGQ